MVSLSSNPVPATAPSDLWNCKPLRLPMIDNLYRQNPCNLAMQVSAIPDDDICLGNRAVWGSPAGRKSGC
jgi:hypothetical protein